MPSIGPASPAGRRLGHLVVVVLFFVGASTLYTYPLLFQLDAAIMTGGGDYLGESALVAWNAHQLVRAPLHLFDAQFYYPHSKTIAYGQSLFFPGLLAVPALAATGQPLLVTNLLMFLALVFSGAFMYLLAFSLTGARVPSLLAGVVFAYFPNRMDHLGQFTVQMGVFLPLIVWAFHRFLVGQRWADLLVVVFGLWAQILSSMYYGFAAGFLLVGFLVACLLLRPQLVSRHFVAKAALGLGLLTALLAPFLKPYLDLHREQGLQRQVWQADWFGMDLLSILDPGVFNTLYGGRLLSLDRSEGGLFPGFLVLGLLALGLWAMGRERRGADVPVAWRRAARRGVLVAALACLAAIVVVPWSGGFTLRLGPISLLKAHDLTLPVNLLPVLALAWLGLEGRWRGSGGLTDREWTITLLFLVVLTYLLTLAPTIWVAGQPWGTAPFRWIFFHVPGGTAFRAPGRWSLVFVVPLALLAAFGARALGQVSGPRARTLLPALCLLGVMVEYLDLPLRWARLPDVPPAYRWLAEQSDDSAVLELPIANGNSDAFYMFWDAVHGKRLVNGAIGFVPGTIQEIVDASDPLDLDSLDARLRAIYPLRYLIVHRGIMTDDERTRWREFPNGHAPALRFVRTFAEWDDVYEVAGTPQAGRRLVRYFSADFVQRHRHATFDVRFPRDPEIRQWVDVVFNGRPVARVGGDGTVMTPLLAPYRAADRNELTFQHRYQLIARAVTDPERYRIGRTGIVAPTDIRVDSAGKEAGDFALIRIGAEEVSPNRRGYNLVVLDPATGRVLAADAFDTHGSEEDAARMARTVALLPVGSIVVGAVRDEASSLLDEAAVGALRSLGVAGDLRGRYRHAHAFVGAKGASPGDAVEAFGGGRLTAQVGRERSPVTLRSFALEAAPGLSAAVARRPDP